MTTLVTVFCHECFDQLTSEDEVVEGVEHVVVNQPGNARPVSVHGSVGIFHLRCWPPGTGDWEATYRGPVEDIRYVRR